MVTAAEISFSLRRVPQIRGKLRYIPLFQLPMETELMFTCSEYKPPEEPRLVNGVEEFQLKILPPGEYGLFIGLFYEAFLLGQHAYSIRFLNRVLAPSAPFEANTILKNENFRLTTGPIESILVLANKKPLYKLHKDDVKEVRKPKVHVRRRRRRKNVPLRKRVC